MAMITPIATAAMAMITPMTMVAVVTTAMIAVIIVTPVMVPTTMVFLIAWDINLAIPIVPHEINRPSTSLITIAEPVPVTLITRWHTQVDGRHVAFWPIAIDQHRLTVNDGGRAKITQLDLTIKSGLANLDRYTNAIGQYR